MRPWPSAIPLDEERFWLAVADLNLTHTRAFEARLLVCSKLQLVQKKASASFYPPLTRDRFGDSLSTHKLFDPLRGICTPPFFD